MKALLEVINRGILKGLHENNIELLADLDDENLDQIDSIQTKTVNNKTDFSIKQQLTDAIQTGKLSGRLKQLINDTANFDKFKGLIKANDKKHLKKLINVGQKLFGTDGNFNWIDTSEITDMSELFYIKSEFNGHIELWDTSNVTDMSFMFNFADEFNQPIGQWDVSNVTNMEYMFKYAELFNQPIGDWNVSNVTNMRHMFVEAVSFNQDISQWNVNNVKDHDDIYYNCPINQKYKPQFYK